MIRVAFRFGDRRLFARLVCLWRGGDSAHCEVSDAWDAGRVHSCVSASWLDGGVRRKSIYVHPSKWRVYEMQGEAAQVRQWLAAHDGQRYDVLGLLGFVVPQIKGWANAWVCSEAVADVLGLPLPRLFDLRTLESVCARYGVRVQ